MFEPSSKPRIFAAPPGVDFAQGLVDGLVSRSKQMTPDALARTEIYVNTTRMQRRIRTVFDAGPPRLLPRIKLIAELANNPVSLAIPPAVSPLRRRLELSQFVSKLLERQPDLAPRAALYDLSDSLADLMDEMQGEGVTPDEIGALDVSDQSGHWERALTFLRIIAPYFNQTDEAPDKEARQRLVIEALTKNWATTPPQHPILIAGSTGSRGATALFMKTVAALPQGAIILPGYDFDLPNTVWDAMADGMMSQDHPQYRFRHLMNELRFDSNDVIPWSENVALHPKRSKLISLSLRPAPVTNQWLEEGPLLGDLNAATTDITLIEATNPRAEAEAIALRLRQAAQDGITAALISPDRNLTRQVTAALDRWDIKPDDSAGTPLALSPPGRMLRHVADLFGKAITSERLLTLLKHPLCNSEREDRGQHLLFTRELELHLRKNGATSPTPDTLKDWAKDDLARQHWVQWIDHVLSGHEINDTKHLADHLNQHLSCAEALCAGPDTMGSGGLWKEAAGREASRICEDLRQAADAGGTIGTADYTALFGGIIADGAVRDRDAGHPNILIWGTLEARVQGVALTVLGGMNEGIWPEAPPPDPWLNRKMRADAGLLLPERRIGLSAHDYQQAVAGAEVWITRSKRSADAETVPSRWVNRLTNLLNGLPDQHGPQALKDMRERGDTWLAMAETLSTPDNRIDPVPRPAPSPPIDARPKRLSVTQIKTLIRDPFSIYGRKVLRLDPLDPLVPAANAQLRGNIVHGILERFISEKHDPLDRDAFMRITNEHFDRECPWPTIRAQWVARMDRLADQFLTAEAERQTLAPNRLVEMRGETVIASANITLTCIADRIDLTEEGDTLIYDYKTGAVPTGPQQEKFDKQLLLEAAMVERGAFNKLGAKSVKSAAFIGINAAMKVVDAPLKKQPVDQVWAELEALFANWQDIDRGYTARLALFSKSDYSPYDHLSRYGEWDTSEQPIVEQLK